MLSGDRPLYLERLLSKIEEGFHYAIVGRNGAGKTTITKLLTGMYDNYEGEIFINGKNLCSYKITELKAIFSVVYQDFAKYYISLEDNIMLGNVLTHDEHIGNCETSLQL